MLACSSVKYETAKKSHRNSPLISKHSQWMTRKAKTTYFFLAKPTRNPAKTTVPFPGRLRARPPQHSPAFGKNPVPLTGTARPPPTPHGAGPAWQPQRSAADRGNAPSTGKAPPRRPKVAGTSRTTRGRAPHPAAIPPSITKPAERDSDPRPPPFTEPPPLTPRPPRYLGRRRALPFLSALPQNGGGFLPLCLLPARG